MLIEEIGRGGQGVVFRAAHRQTGEIVAVKTVLPQDLECAETLTRFQREAAAGQRLDHPHCMPIIMVGTSDEGLPFFSMELAVGGSLYDLAAKYRGRWKQTAELIEKVSRAVDHAHQSGIIHRDLKPGNILFTEAQEPLVADFGLVKQVIGSDDLTLSCAVLGTPSYVAPEQASGRTRELSTAVDIYSLGAILFELLTGRPPFVGDNALAVLQEAASQSPERPRRLVPTIPRALETICLRCLERQPHDRYGSARDLADDLGRWLQGRRIKGHPPYVRLWRNVKSRLTLLAGCSAVAGMAAVVWMSWIASGRASRPANAVIPIIVEIDNFDRNPHLGRIARQTTDALQRGLSKTRNFHLQQGEPQKSQTSTEIFDPLAFGRACDAQAVLTGSVRCSGQSVRLVTRLMRCDTGEVVWSRVDSIPSDHIDVTLPVVAKKIANDLEKRSQGNPRGLLGASAYAPLPKAQTFYTRGLELASHANQSDLRAAATLFRQAADTDPHFAAARAMLAYALWVQTDAFGELDKLPLALSAAREALAIDPGSAQAHRVIAYCELKASRRNEALEEFWCAFETNPQSAGCCQSLGLCLRAMGHPLQSLNWFERAFRLDPAHGASSATLGETFAICGYDRQADEALSRAISIEGDRADFQFALSALRTWQKKFGEALQLCAQTHLRFPENRCNLVSMAWIDLCDQKDSDAEVAFEKLRSENFYEQDFEYYGAINPSSALAYLAAKAGDAERARNFAEAAMKIDRELLDKYPNNSRILHDLSATYAVVGETEGALELLQESISAGWVERRSTRIDPRFLSISNLPRFDAILTATLPDSL